MNSIIERYLSHLEHEQHCSAHTVLAYGRDLRQLERFLTDNGKREARFAEVEQMDIRTWVAWRLKQGDSQRTVRRKLQSVRSFYRYLMRCGLVTENPAAEVESARLPKRLPTFVRDTQMDFLLNSDVDLNDEVQVRDRLVVMMLYETGIRRAELMTLTDDSVDTDKGEMKVRGKRDKDRIVPFGTELAVWIKRYRALRDDSGNRGATLFTRHHGEPLYPSLLYKIVTSQLEQAGVTGKRSPHVLRHSFATAMLNAGAGLNSVKELLGHESVATTQVYTHVTTRDLINNYKHAHPRALKKGGNYGN